jgi:hypothetical protein
MLYLYGTSSCHLCEEASAFLVFLKQELQFDWTEADIADDDKLLQRYGLKIPVLYRTDNDAELCWPFSRDAIKSFLLTSP